MTNANAIRNTAQLVKVGVAQLQAAGWSEERIIAQIPYLANEAVKFLATKAAA